MLQSDNSPDDIRVPLPIVRVPPGDRLRVIFLCKRWTGVQTHFYGGKTLWCPGLDECGLCSIGRRRVWQGYIFAKCAGAEHKCLLHFTNMAWSMIDEHMKGERNWFGLSVILQRANEAKNAPLRAYVYGRQQGLAEESYMDLCAVVNSIYRKNGCAPLKDTSQSLPSNGEF